MKLLAELAQLIEMDELSCIECGEDLESELDFEYGVCENCINKDKRRGSQFDGAREEDCQYMEYYTDEDGKILSEGAVRMFKKVGKKIIRKYRCTSGPKKGKPVSDPSKCAQRKDPAKVRRGKKIMRKGKATRKRKSKITKKTAISKMVTRLNKGLSKGQKSLSKKTTLKPSSTKFTKVTNASTTTVKAKGLTKAAKPKKTK